MEELEERVLRAVARGVLDSRRLSKDLGVDDVDVKRAMFMLVAKGMLREEVISGSSCAGCPLRFICPYSKGGGSRVRVYVVTDKGREVLMGIRAGKGGSA